MAGSIGTPAVVMLERAVTRLFALPVPSYWPNDR